MSRRKAVYRIVGAVAWFGLVGWIVALLATIGAAVFFLGDIFVTLYNGEGWSKGGGMVPAWSARLYYWQIEVMEWIVFGSGSFPWTP